MITSRTSLMPIMPNSQKKEMYVIRLSVSLAKHQPLVRSEILHQKLQTVSYLKTSQQPLHQNFLMLNNTSITCTPLKAILTVLLYVYPVSVTSQYSLYLTVKMMVVCILGCMFRLEGPANYSTIPLKNDCTIENSTYICRSINRSITYLSYFLALDDLNLFHVL